MQGKQDGKTTFFPIGGLYLSAGFFLQIVCFLFSDLVIFLNPLFPKLALANWNKKVDEGPSLYYVGVF